MPEFDELASWESYLDIEEYYDYPVQRHNKQCKYCGESGFTWKKTMYGWRLSTVDGVVHTCLHHTR